MPDLLLVFAKRWKLILTITFAAALIAFIVTLLSPKKYLSVATALPVNSATADKARIFNPNIQYLYSDFGSSDELYRIEGTATLDTIFIAASKELHLDDHYSIKNEKESTYKAAIQLKKNTKINRSNYGELKVKVWDKEPNKAAELANYLMQKLQELHQHLQNQSNLSVLEKIKQEYASKQKEYLQLADSLDKGQVNTSAVNFASAKKEILKTKMTALTDQLLQYEKMMGEYQLAATANSPVLLVVENARPSLLPDKPKTGPTVLFALFGALLFSFMIVLFIESRKHTV